MAHLTDEERRRVFQQLHDPKRAVYQVSHARRENEAEDYNSEKLLNAAKAIVQPHVESAQQVIGIFESRSVKREQ